MVCNNCGQYFCYRCNKAISGYEHFKEGTCDLFPQEATQEWNEIMNERQVIDKFKLKCFHNTCVDGKQQSLVLLVMSSTFYYLCKKVVKKSAQHYGPKGSKQHTDG